MRKFLKPSILSMLLFLTVIRESYSWQEPGSTSHPITLEKFLSAVMKGNIGLIAEQFNVSIAEANVISARAFPDPEISAVYSNNEDRRLQMGQSVEGGISYPVSLGNKRRAGINLSRSEYELSKQLLDAYFQNLRADAARSFFAALRDQEIHRLQENIYMQLSGLASADSVRLIQGETTALDALQSSLVARSQMTELFQSRADLKNSSLNLQLLQGRANSDTLEIPTGNFPVKKRDFILDKLIGTALEKRAELMVALKNKEVSEKSLQLLKANKAFEFSIETGYSYNSVVKNEIAPAPAFNGLSAGISFPLKFSNFNKGSLQAASLHVKQSQTFLKDMEIRVISEVVNAYHEFIAQEKKVDHYQRGLVEDAGRILEGRVYSYQHGESGLIDVLNAQKTYTELQLSYIEVLFRYTSALIELERAAGIWDITD